MADFTPMNTGFYEPGRENEWKYGFGIIIILTLGGIIFFVRRRNKIRTKKENQVDETNGIGDFKSIELDLIEKIYKSTVEGKNFSVEDINAAIGLSKKSLEIQKKIRTETINRINHRFKIIFNTEDELIERIRLEEDRRYYKYIISEENGKKALGI